MIISLTYSGLTLIGLAQLDKFYGCVTECAPWAGLCVAAAVFVLGGCVVKYQRETKVVRKAITTT